MSGLNKKLTFNVFFAHLIQEKPQVIRRTLLCGGTQQIIAPSSLPPSYYCLQMCLLDTVTH